MCFAFPGLVERISKDKAEVDFLGKKREVSLELLDVKTGDYVIVCGGYAIEKVEKDIAEETIGYWRELIDGFD